MSQEILLAKALQSAEGLESVAAVLDSDARKLGGTWTIAGTWADRLRERAKARRARRFKILVMGEFKRGKSTLINAMLGHRALPQRVTPCSAVATTVVYGQTPLVTLHGADQTQQTMTLEEFARDYSLKTEDTAQDDTDEILESADREEERLDRIVRDRFGHIQDTVMEYPAEICREGVALVDSPGLSEHPDRQDRTFRQLREADAVIFVLHALQLLNQRERRVIERNLASFRNEQKLFFAINGWNLLLQSLVNPEDEEEKREAFAEQEKRIDQCVRPLLGAAAEERIFRVNALGALQWRTTPTTPELLENTGMPALESAIRHFLSHDRLRAEQSSDRELLHTVQLDVERQSQMELRGYHVSVSELETEYEEKKPLLNHLRATKRHVENLIKAAGADLVQKLCDSLDDHFRENIEADLDDAVGVIDLGPAGDMLTRISVLFDWFKKDADKAKKLIEKHLADTITGYLQPKINDWWDLGAQSIIRTNLSKLSIELDKETDSYESTLNAITRGSGGSKALEGIINQALQKIAAHRSNELTDFGLDLGPLLGAALVEIISHTIFHTALTFSLPVVGLIISGIMMWWRKGKAETELRKKLLEALRKELPVIRDRIKEELRKKGDFSAPSGRSPRTISEAFDTLTEGINSGIDEQINQLDATMRDLIARKGQGQEKADKRQLELESFYRTFTNVIEKADALLS
jgi:ribosome biogenesis GTPase A